MCVRRPNGLKSIEKKARCKSLLSRSRCMHHNGGREKAPPVCPRCCEWSVRCGKSLHLSKFVTSLPEVFPGLLTTSTTTTLTCHLFLSVTRVRGLPRSYPPDTDRSRTTFPTLSRPRESLVPHSTNSPTVVCVTTHTTTDQSQSHLVSQCTHTNSHCRARGQLPH